MNKTERLSWRKRRSRYMVYTDIKHEDLIPDSVFYGGRSFYKNIAQALRRANRYAKYTFPVYIDHVTHEFYRGKKGRWYQLMFHFLDQSTLDRVMQEEIKRKKARVR